MDSGRATVRSLNSPAIEADSGSASSGSNGAAAADSFEARVGKLFGSSLFASVPSSGFPSSSWSVAGGAVERREWNRDRGDTRDRENDPCAAAFDGENVRCARPRRVKRDFEGDLDEEENDGVDGSDEDEREELNMRSSIGLDPTLDDEEEEDEFDRAALHRNNAGDRMYMNEINDHGPYLNSNTVLDNHWDDGIEEAYDDHWDLHEYSFSANTRLKVDQKHAEGHSLSPHRTTDASNNLTSKTYGFEVNLKPILKRKENHVDSKPKKRVRFDSGCKVESDPVPKDSQETLVAPASIESGSFSEDQFLPKQYFGDASSEGSVTVPDHVKNPSKYTHYTSDPSDGYDDDRVNKCAFDDFFNMVRQSSTCHEMDDTGADLPKFITFNPRKKLADPVVMDNDSAATQESKSTEIDGKLTPSTGIAVGENEKSGMCHMEEDDMEASTKDPKAASRKHRQYRPKVSPDNGA